VGIKYHGNLPWYFNLRKSRYCSKLPWYFYNTDQKYNGILTLEKGGTMVNYCGIFITLAQLATSVSDKFCNFYLGKNIKVFMTQQPLKLEKK
jgi:hypothetical protein